MKLYKGENYTRNINICNKINELILNDLTTTISAVCLSLFGKYTDEKGKKISPQRIAQIYQSYVERGLIEDKRPLLKGGDK